MKVLLLTGFLLATLTNAAHAAFMTQDWATTGDKGIVTDTNTGKQWLRADFTHGQSSATMQARLAQGGDLYGWRIANSSEVFGLLSGVWGEDSLNPASTWYSYNANRLTGADFGLITLFEYFGGAYSSPSGNMNLDVFGYHLSDAVNPGSPWAYSGAEKTYTLYDENGAKVWLPGIGANAMPAEYFTDHRNYNQTFNAPDVVAINNDFDVRSYSDYGKMTFNMIVPGGTIGINDAHWWLVNEFASSNLVSESGVGSPPSDVNGTVPASAVLGLFALAFWRRKKTNK